MLLSIMRQLLVLLPAAFIIGGKSLENMWYAFPIAEVFALWCFPVLPQRVTVELLPDRPETDLPGFAAISAEPPPGSLPGTR